MDEDKDIQKALSDFILVKINAEDGDGKDVAENHLVQGYPTFVALTPQGETAARWTGYKKDMFLDRASEVSEDPTTIEEKLARYREKPTADDAASLGRYHDSRGEYARALSYFQMADRLGRSSGENYLMEIFETAYYGAREEVFTFDELNLHAGLLFSNPEASLEDQILAARMMLSFARGKGSQGLATSYVEMAVERSEESGNPDVEEARALLLPDYALLVEKDKEKALASKKAILKEGWMDSSSQLNAFAWWCFENELNLEEAKTLAARGVELEEEDASKAMILDTLAEIQNALGNPKEALATMKKAAALDPDKEHYQKQITRFEGLVAKGGAAGK